MPELGELEPPKRADAVPEGLLRRRQPITRDVRSHCEEEFTPMDDIESGANTLFLAALELAGRV